MTTLFSLYSDDNLATKILMSDGCITSKSSAEVDWNATGTGGAGSDIDDYETGAQSRSLLEKYPKLSILSVELLARRIVRENRDFFKALDRDASGQRHFKEVEVQEYLTPQQKLLRGITGQFVRRKRPIDVTTDNSQCLVTQKSNKCSTSHFRSPPSRPGPTRDKRNSDNDNSVFDIRACVTFDQQCTFMPQLVIGPARRSAAITDHIICGLFFKILNMYKKHPFLEGLTVRSLNDTLLYCPATIEECSQLDNCGHWTTDMRKKIVEWVCSYLESRYVDIKILREVKSLKTCYTDGSSSYAANQELTKNIKSILDGYMNMMVSEQQRGIVTGNIMIPMSYFEFLTMSERAYTLDFKNRQKLEESIQGQKKDSSTGQNTMYGAVTESFVEFLIQFSSLGRNDRFLDIGSGIGQVVMQVAATVGCVSYGIEIIKERHEAGITLINALNKCINEVTFNDRALDNAILINSGMCEAFKDPDIFDRLKSCNVIFWNNAHGWFSDRNKSHVSKDLHEIFMKEMLPTLIIGTQIITVDELTIPAQLFSKVISKRKNYMVIK